MKKLLVGVFLFSSAPLLAQQAVTGINGLQFLAPMQFAAGRDNNFLVDRTTPSEKLFVMSLAPSIQPGAPDIRPKILDDTVFTARMPKIGYVNDSKRHEFIATWLPEFEVFANNSDQNAMNQQALGSFNYYLRRNIQIWLGDKFQTSKDPARTLSNVLVLLPRGPYRENSFGASVEFQPNRVTNVGILYNTAYTKFGQTDPFQARILDSRSSGYTVNVARLLSRTQRISFRYSLFTISRANVQKTFDEGVDAPRPSDTPIHSLTLQYRMRLDPITSLGVSGGTTKSIAGIDYIFSGSVTRRIGNFVAGAIYQRSLAFQARADNGFVQGPDNIGFYDMIVLRFRGQPTPDTAVLFDTSMSRAVPSSVVEGHRSLMSHLRFDYRISDRNVLFTSWESFHQSNNVYVQSPLSRNRFMMGIEISLAGETERRISRRNEDAEYVALTDHAIRRRTLEED